MAFRYDQSVIGSELWGGAQVVFVVGEEYLCILHENDIYLNLTVSMPHCPMIIDKNFAQHVHRCSAQALRC